MPPDHRPRGIPWPVDLVLVLLQSNQPPTASAHGKTCQKPSQEGPNQSSFPTSTRNRDANSSTSAHDEEYGQCEMSTP